ADREVDVASLTVSVQQTDRPEYTRSDLDYQSLFRRVREVRENSLSSEELLALIDELQVNHPNEWLCRLEILEILEDREAHTDACRQLRSVLNKRKTEDPSLSKRIENGLGIIDARLKFE
ncbi:MAG: hypothetical protein ACK5VH_09390, partial [bacterium]